MNIDEIEKAHKENMSNNEATVFPDSMQRKILDRESALIAKVRELEKDKKAQEVFDASRIKLIAVQADRITQLEKDKALAVQLLDELHILVKWETPSILNEDSGGDWRLSIAIEEYLKQHGGEKA